MDQYIRGKSHPSIHPVIDMTSLDLIWLELSLKALRIFTREVAVLITGAAVENGSSYVVPDRVVLCNLGGSGTYDYRCKCKWLSHDERRKQLTYFPLLLSPVIQSATTDDLVTVYSRGISYEWAHSTNNGRCVIKKSDFSPMLRLSYVKLWCPVLWSERASSL